MSADLYIIGSSKGPIRPRQNAAADQDDGNRDGRRKNLIAYTVFGTPKLGLNTAEGIKSMFGFFKKKQPPADLPTEKQRRYAARLGIEVSASMSKAELSAAIYQAERRNPALAQNREQVKQKVREGKFGKELVQQEGQWNRFAGDVGYMLAVYRRGKETIVDVLRVNEAFITDRGKLKLGVEAPKVVKDRYIGDHLEWDKHFELLLESILHHEPLHTDFHNDGNDAYRKVVEKGLKIARKMASGS